MIKRFILISSAVAVMFSWPAHGQVVITPTRPSCSSVSLTDVARSLVAVLELVRPSTEVSIEHTAEYMTPANRLRQQADVFDRRDATIQKARNVVSCLREAGILTEASVFNADGR